MGYINFLLSILVIFALWNFYKKREDEEKYIGWKIIGYYVLGIFTFSFNTFPIPLGFAVFLLFFKPALNKKVKAYAAYTGLAMFLLSNIIPFAQDMIYEYPRKVEANSMNVYEFAFEENWETMRDVIDVRSAKMNTIDLEYDIGGNIELFRFSGVTRNTVNERINFWITLDESNETFEIRRSKSEYEQPVHLNDSRDDLSVMNFFRMLDEADFTKLRPSPHSEHFEMRAHEMSKMYYAVKENDKYAVWGDQVVEISNDQLPVYGYQFDICGKSGAEKVCTEYANYLFGAELNAKDDVHE